MPEGCDQKSQEAEWNNCCNREQKGIGMPDPGDPNIDLHFPFTNQK